MAKVETHPESLFCLPGKIRLIKKASSGINTAARVNLMVRISMACKNCFNLLPGRYVHRARRPVECLSFRKGNCDYLSCGYVVQVIDNFSY